MNQARVNFLSGPALRAVALAIALVSYPAYLRLLGFEQYGVWLVLSSVLMFSQLGNLGLAQALAKVVAEAWAEGDTLLVRQYTTVATATLGASGLAVWASLYAGRAPIASALGLAGAHTRMGVGLLPWFGALAMYVFLADAQANVVAGLGRQDVANAIDVVAQAISAAVGIALARVGYGIPGLLSAGFASQAVKHAVALLVAARLLRAPLFALSVPSREPLCRLTSLAAGLFGGTAAGLLLNPFNRLVLARFAGFHAVPLYEIAYNSAMQIRSLFAAASAALAPEVSRVHASFAPDAARRAILRIMREALVFVTACGAPLYAAVFFGAAPLLQFWLRGRFVPAQAEALRIMLAGSFLSLLGTAPYFTLVGLHCGRKVLCSYLVQSGVNVGGIAAVWMWSDAVPLRSVLLATSAGMAASTLYLAWAGRHALSGGNRG